MGVSESTPFVAIENESSREEPMVHTLPPLVGEGGGDQCWGFIDQCCGAHVEVVGSRSRD
jgi:hypothetical protein